MKRYNDHKNLRDIIFNARKYIINADGVGLKELDDDIIIDYTNILKDMKTFCEKIFDKCTKYGHFYRLKLVSGDHIYNYYMISGVDIEKYKDDMYTFVAAIDNEIQIDGRYKCLEVEVISRETYDSIRDKHFESLTSEVKALDNDHYYVIVDENILLIREES